jgi:TetR/AcrR family transcriptional repressor of nem operon
VAQHSNRQTLLKHGLSLVHERGFAGSSVRDIVQAAGVPQGSFTNHFASKEAFGLEVLELYHLAAREVISTTLSNPALSPLRRLRAWCESQLERLKSHDMRRGCLYGNFSVEASEHSEAIRRRVAEMLRQTQDSIAQCLEAAVAAGELPPETETSDVASFLLSSLQGAIVVSKAERSAEPVERCLRVVFSALLPPAAPGGRRASPRYAKAAKAKAKTKKSPR